MSTVQILYTVKHLITKLRLWHWWVCFRRRRRLSAYKCIWKIHRDQGFVLLPSNHQKEENVSFWKATSLLLAWFVGLFVALRPSTYLAFMMWKEKWSETTQIKTHCHFHVPQTTKTNRKYSQWKQPRNSFYVSMAVMDLTFFFFLLFCFTGHIMLTPRDTHESNNKPASRQNKCNANK